MTTRLVLNVKKEAAEKGERLSRKRNKTISRLFEEFLESLPEEEISKKISVRELSAQIRKNVSLPDNINYNQFIKEERYKDLLKEMPLATRKSKR